MVQDLFSLFLIPFDVYTLIRFLHSKSHINIEPSKGVGKNSIALSRGSRRD